MTPARDDKVERTGRMLLKQAGISDQITTRQEWQRRDWRPASKLGRVNGLGYIPTRWPVLYCLVSHHRDMTAKYSGNLSWMAPISIESSMHAGVAQLGYNYLYTIIGGQFTPSVPSVLQAKAAKSIINQMKGTDANALESFAESLEMLLSLSSPLKNLRKGFKKLDDMVSKKTMKSIPKDHPKAPVTKPKLSNLGITYRSRSGQLVRIPVFGLSSTSVTNSRVSTRRAWDRRNLEGLDIALQKVSTFAANSYLAWQFGIKPIISDMMSAYNIALDGLKKPIDLSTNVKEDFFKQISLVPDASAGSYKFEGYADRGVRAGCSVRWPNSKLGELAAIGGLDILSAPWAVVPFSFVIDWFTGIGDTLSALTLPFFVEFINYYETSYVVMDVIVRTFPESKAYYTTTKSDYGEYRYQATCMDRKPLLAPIPGLYLRWGLNSRNGLSALAMGFQRFAS